MAVGKYSGERIQGMGPVPRLCPRAASIRHARGTQLQEVSDGLEGGGGHWCVAKGVVEEVGLMKIECNKVNCVD